MLARVCIAQPPELDGVTHGELVVDAAANIISMVPSFSGNIAIDLVGLIVALCLAMPFIRGSTDSLCEVQKKRTKLITLRKTLELKSVEVAALRVAMMQARQDLGQQRQERLNEEAERTYLSHLVAQQEFDPQHSELEERLREAISRPPNQFDA